MMWRLLLPLAWGLIGAGAGAQAAAWAARWPRWEGWPEVPAGAFVGLVVLALVGTRVPVRGRPVGGVVLVLGALAAVFGENLWLDGGPPGRGAMAWCLGLPALAAGMVARAWGGGGAALAAGLLGAGVAWSAGEVSALPAVALPAAALHRAGAGAWIVAALAGHARGTVPTPPRPAWGSGVAAGLLVGAWPLWLLPRVEMLVPPSARPWLVPAVLVAAGLGAALAHGTRRRPSLWLAAGAVVLACAGHESAVPLAGLLVPALLLGAAAGAWQRPLAAIAGVLVAVALGEVAASLAAGPALRWAPLLWAGAMVVVLLPVTAAGWVALALGAAVVLLGLPAAGTPWRPGPGADDGTVVGRGPATVVRFDPETGRLALERRGERRDRWGPGVPDHALLADLPMLLDPGVRQVCVLGPGSGRTASALADWAPGRIVAVAPRRWTAPVRRAAASWGAVPPPEAPVAPEGVRFHRGGWRRFLAGQPAAFDLVTWGGLAEREGLTFGLHRTVRKALAPGGRFAVALELEESPRVGLADVLDTAAAVHGGVDVLLVGDVVLLLCGATAEGRVWPEELPRAAAARLHDAGLAGTADLVAARILARGPGEGARLRAGHPVPAVTAGDGAVLLGRLDSAFAAARIRLALGRATAEDRARLDPRRRAPGPDTLCHRELRRAAGDRTDLSPLADLAAWPGAAVVVRRALGNGAGARALRAAYAPRVARALVDVLHRRPLKDDEQEALRAVADPAVLVRAVAAVAGRGGDPAREVLPLWGRGLPLVAPLAALAGGDPPARKALAAALGGRTGRRARDTLASLLVDGDTEVVRAAAVALFRTVGHDLLFDPTWPLERRRRAAERFRDLPLRSP